MKTNNNLYSNISPKPSPKRGLIVIVSLIVVLLIIALVAFFINNSKRPYENTGGYYELSFEKVDGYNDMLNIYYNLPSELPEDYFNEILEKSGIDKNYIQINRDGGESFIAATKIDPSADLTGQTIEYISFDYVPPYDESTVPTIENVTYHSFRSGRHDYIFESAEGEFTHVSDDLSNTYDNKLFAIDSYLMTL